jgi:hypothetical protein
VKLKPGIPLIDQIPCVELQFPIALKFPGHLRLMRHLNWRDRSLCWFFVSNSTIGFKLRRRQWERLREWAAANQVNLEGISILQPPPAPQPARPRNAAAPAASGAAGKAVKR